MAADPKDTTVTDENPDGAAEVAAKATVSTTGTATASRKLSAEELIKGFEHVFFP